MIMGTAEVAYLYNDPLIVKHNMNNVYIIFILP